MDIYYCFGHCSCLSEDGPKPAAKYSLSVFHVKPRINPRAIPQRSKIAPLKYPADLLYHFLEFVCGDTLVVTGDGTAEIPDHQIRREPDMTLILSPGRADIQFPDDPPNKCQITKNSVAPDA